jgi:hypothetical protein
MSLLPRRTVPAALAIAALGLAGAAPGALARHGADDPAGDDHGAHHGIHHHGVKAQRADDHRQGSGHRGGLDDGPSHR